MKLNKIFPIVLSCFVVLFSCSDTATSDADGAQQSVEQEETATAKDNFSVDISGQLQGGQGLQLYFDQAFYDSFNPLEKVTIDANGNFSVSAKDIEPGVYRLRVSDKKILLILDGSETTITCDADLAKVPNLIYDLNGSKPSNLYQNIGKQMFALLQKGQFNEANVQEMVDTTSNSLVAAFWTYTTLPLPTTFRYPNPEIVVKTHESAIQKLAKDYPGSRYVQDYRSQLSPILAQLATQKIRIGVQAPDISLPNPDGKNYSLSDLKGKVVLLDFWASWCRPCRMNNPEVVRVYNKYQKQGFTVFSVSLDGLDQATKSRFNGNEATIAQYIDREKEKWQNAIQQDNLTWKYHVSDLKKWDCSPAKDYGVTGIPKTYLLDKEGKIVAINPHGAALEREVKKLL
ncbi:MAG: peroxiredoxin [Saprospiraceae bacterium]|mgnify:CR=1 FL=1|jgi:peroxiredoxin